MGQEPKPKSKPSMLEKPWSIVAALAGLIVGAWVIIAVSRTASDALSTCAVARSRARAIAEYAATPLQLRAIVHYATSKVTPQQSLKEISISFDVLRFRAPCNFLVFGLGHDSLMWAALNPGGTTVFLEEDPDWIATVVKSDLTLRVHHVKYRTQLQQASSLLASWRNEPSCLPSRAFLRDNERCPLALTGLADEFYDTQWDLIMIDAPRGYFPTAPGRMGAIYSAAVMARQRREGMGSTDVFLHDVNRQVEKVFAEEFLCAKYRVGAEGRLWHFEIPPASNSTGPPDRFC